MHLRGGTYLRGGRRPADWSLADSGTQLGKSPCPTQLPRVSTSPVHPFLNGQTFIAANRAKTLIHVINFVFSDLVLEIFSRTTDHRHVGEGI